MVHKESQISFSKGALGPLSIGELRTFNIFLKTWIKEQPPGSKGLVDIVDRASQYFDHVIDVETTVGKIE